MNKKNYLNVFGILLTAWLGMSLPLLSDRPASAESSVSQPGVKRKASVERGRDIFHGNGACSYCHGMDGYLDRLPHMKEDIAARKVALLGADREHAQRRPPQQPQGGNALQ